MRALVGAGLLSLATVTLLIAQGPTYSSGQMFTVNATLSSTCNVGETTAKSGAAAGLYFCTATNTWTQLSTGSGAVPAGLITLILSGTCPATWTEVSALNGKMLRGTLAANADVGTLGGSDSVTPAGTVTAPTLTMNSYTPAGSVTAPTFTGNSVASSLVSAGTPAGTNGTGTVTPLGTIAWPVGVPLFTGTGGTVPAQVFTGSSATSSAVSGGTPAGTNATVAFTPLGAVTAPVFTGSALATHAHELPWQIPSTTTIRQIAIATFGTGTSRAATAVSAAGVANTTAAAVALSQAVTAGTPAGTNSVPTFTGTAGTIPAEVFTGAALATHQHTVTATGTNGTAAFTPAGTVAWPAGVPVLSGSSSVTSAEVFTGSALGTHQHTTTATGTNSAPTFSGTPATLTGSNSVPTFTGTALDTRAAYTNVIFCSKN